MTAAPSGDDPGSILSDPRIEPDHLRAFDADGDPLVLVGAVHDHPASAYRAGRVVRALGPDVVGVELPRLALPLFERRAAAWTGDDVPPATTGGSDDDGRTDEGAEAIGEFAAALAAGADVGAESVAIDALDWRFAASLWREFGDADASAGTLRRVLGAVGNVTTHAASCRLAASLGDRWPRDPVGSNRFDHDVSPRASPRHQADHESRQLSRSRSILRALERPAADDLVDAARERTMAATLAARRSAGGTVAVVGFDHFDGIATHLAGRGFERRDADPAWLNRRWG